MDRDRVKRAIQGIAQHRKTVRFREIETLLDNHVSKLFPKYNHHRHSSHHAFTVGSQTFTIPEPHHGPVKRQWVELFLDAMEYLDLYERED